MRALSKVLVDRLEPGMVLLADRGNCGFDLRRNNAKSATELAAAYAQRWEIESAFDELETHQRGPRTVLRSKSPELVKQEIWGHLCCHYAIRTLMFAAAHEAAVNPDRVSFVAALRISRVPVGHSQPKHVSSSSRGQSRLELDR